MTQYRMTGAEFETYLADVRTLVLAEIESMVAGSEPALQGVLYELMLDYPMRPAKALRPALAMAVCLGLGGREGAIAPSAAVLELFHNAFLIHDDIEDGSLLRRGEPTFHRLHGTSLAINMGDAMLALALQPLLGNMATMGMGPALRILQAVFEMAQASTEGQAIELDWIRHHRWDLTDADYLDMVRRKTSMYTFVTPLAVGAIAAGAPQDRVEALRALGVHIGAAFQIHDDLLNLEEEDLGYGKESWGDLWEGKRTLPVLHALRQLSPTDADRARTLLDRPRPDMEVDASVLDVLPRVLTKHVELGTLSSEAAATILEDATQVRTHSTTKSHEDIAWMRHVVEETGGMRHARSVAEAHCRAAREALEHTRSWLHPSVHRGFLTMLVDYATDRRR